jgi:hypothetical protein
MSKYTGRIFVPVLIAAVALTAACGGDGNRADSALAVDTSLNRDLALAGQDTAAQPSLTDVPATPSTKTKTPTTTTKRPTTSAPTKTASGNTKTSSSSGAGRVGMIPAGTTLTLRANNQICTNTNKAGDKLTATLNESVVGSNGATIPAGATVTLTVTQLKRSENVNDKIIMAFTVDNVTFSGKTYALDASVTSQDVDRVRNQPKSADAKKVIGGAAIGAIAGQVLGKNTKSTVIGAAAGAAAGAATAAATANYEGCIRAGAPIVVQLNNAVQVVV